MTIRFLWSARVVLALCAFSLIATPKTAAAGPLTFTGVVFNDGSCIPYVNCVVDPENAPNDADPGDIGFGGTGLIQVSGEFGGALLSGAADAAAGLLRTKASASYDLAEEGYWFAAAAALVSDSLTITSADYADHTSGSLNVSLSFDGTVTKSGTADAGTIVAVLWGGTGPFEGQEFEGFTTSTSTNQVISVDVPFKFGESFLLTMFMFSTAGTIGVCDSLEACPDTEGTTPFEGLGVGAATADFFNTLLITGLVPTVGGVRVVNPLFTAESGAEYTVNGVVPAAVPEPATLMLLGSGVTALIARRRHKRSC